MPIHSSLTLPYGYISLLAFTYKGRKSLKIDATFVLYQFLLFCAFFHLAHRYMYMMGKAQPLILIEIYVQLFENYNINHLYAQNKANTHKMCQMKLVVKYNLYMYWF